MEIITNFWEQYKVKLNETHFFKNFAQKNWYRSKTKNQTGKFDISAEH